VTEKIVFNRMKKGITWAALAEAVGKSLPWTTSALLGQHQMSEEEAKAAGDMLDLTEDEIMLLTYVPFKGSFGKPGELVPTDPLIYRFYEMVMVYGTTYKEMIHEEFGDGIMSAIDFDMEFARQPNGDLGDRVKIVLTGKYLTYKKF
jgi:cyanate lyase